MCRELCFESRLLYVPRYVIIYTMPVAVFKKISFRDLHTAGRVGYAVRSEDKTFADVFSGRILIERRKFYMIRLFTDSGANLPRDLAEKYGITVIPLRYSIDGESVDPTESAFDGKAFYDAMRSGAEVRTSMINIMDFSEAFRKALSEGNDVLYVGMSGGISGTAHAAAVAAEELASEFPANRIAAVDTFAASLGEGLLVLECGEMIRKGHSFAEITGYVSSRRNTMCQFFTVDDLEYLKKGGRISGVADVVGTILKIKPILTGAADGRIVSCGKVRGTKAALTDLADRYESLAADKSAPIGIAHADNEEGHDALLQMLSDRGFTGSCLSVFYEPVTGSHVGPGTVALFFQGKHK